MISVASFIGELADYRVAFLIAGVLCLIAGVSFLMAGRVLRSHAIELCSHH